MAIDEKQETTHESQIGLTKQRSSQTKDVLTSTSTIIIIDDDDEETLDSKNKKTDKEETLEPKEETLDSPTFNSLVSLPSNDVITTVDKEETLEPKTKKKPRLGSWWDYVGSFNELSIVVKGLPNNDDVSRVDSCSSSTTLHKKEKNGSSEEEILGSGYRHVTLEELGVTVEDLKSMPWELFDPIWEIRSETMDPWLGGYIKDIISPDHYNSQA
ncbi:unnamed protein product [Arabis nemorensis]|uniref:Uncharacterized protein n=1 Tax=Arabis nemorensis TaxID=586526 RepID=A0A565AY32_9BRAS|nr:unnamed protein product [Arabis nemorensis]